MFYDNLENEVEHYKTEYLSSFSSQEYNIIICIENYDDEPFWKFIFSHIPNIKPFFHYLDGKSNILKFESYFDSEFVGCIDSDYDYILQKNYLNNQYIFHTYVYSIENYCVCAKTLNSLILSLNIFSPIDFESLFTEMSILIEEVLLYDIFLKDNSIESIRGVLKFNNIPMENITQEYILTSIKNQIDNKNLGIDSLQIDEYKEFIKKNIHIEENFLHLYLEGHIVFDSILNIFEKLQNSNIKSKIEKIKDNNEFSGEQKGHKINELKNKKFNVYTGLKLNYKECYYHNSCPSFRQIISDIKYSIGGI